MRMAGLRCGELEKSNLAPPGTRQSELGVRPQLALGLASQVDRVADVLVGSTEGSFGSPAIYPSLQHDNGNGGVARFLQCGAGSSALHPGNPLDDPDAALLQLQIAWPDVCHE